MRAEHLALPVLRRVSRSPRLAPAVELIRFDSAVQDTDRIATGDLDVGGARIRRGQMMMLARRPS